MITLLFVAALPFTGLQRLSPTRAERTRSVSTNRPEHCRRQERRFRLSPLSARIRRILRRDAVASVRRAATEGAPQPSTTRSEMPMSARNRIASSAAIFRRADRRSRISGWGRPRVV